jgi:hypothetical protein
VARPSLAAGAEARATAPAIIPLRNATWRARLASGAALSGRARGGGSGGAESHATFPRNLRPRDNTFEKRDMAGAARQVCLAWALDWR